MDVLLFVTRLDASRVANYDREHLSYLCHLFGQHVLHSVVFVLTRGASLPPLNLSFAEFVTLRSDLLYLHVKHAFHPVQLAGGVGIEHAPDLIQQHQQQHDDHQQQPLTDAALKKLQDSITRDWQRHKPTPAVKKLCSILLNDDSTDAGSTSALPSTFLDDLFLSAVYPLDRRVFVDPPRPPTVVVELAESAPTNHHGHIVLPDGSPWIHSLVDAMVTTANRVRAERQPEAQRQRQQQQELYRPEPLNWWRRLHREIVCGGIRTAVIGAAMLYIGAFTYSEMIDRHRRWREAQDDGDDVLMKLDDAEYERLTKPDPGTDGSVILSNEPEPVEEEQLKDEEKQFFGSEQPEEIYSEPQANGEKKPSQSHQQGAEQKPPETKGGDVHIDWDNMDGDSYSDTYSLENESKWKHLVPKDTNW